VMQINKFPLAPSRHQNCPLAHNQRLYCGAQTSFQVNACAVLCDSISAESNHTGPRALLQNTQMKGNEGVARSIPGRRRVRSTMPRVGRHPTLSTEVKVQRWQSFNAARRWAAVAAADYSQHGRWQLRHTPCTI
jgi:hypothetical protein